MRSSTGPSVGGLARFFPEHWARLEAGAAAGRGAGPAGEGDIVDTYYRLLADGDPAVRERAAAAWCAWESATVAWPPETELAPKFRDPRFALAFARIVTHYVRHNAWLDDGVLLRQAATLDATPGVLINARLDLQAPLQNAWRLREAWPAAELVVVDGSRHGASGPVEQAIVEASDAFRP